MGLIPEKEKSSDPGLHERRYDPDQDICNASSIEEFAELIRLLDNCGHGIVDKRFATTSSYFVIDENGKLIGAASLRHYLTVEGYQTWGHIGYGVRPGERRKGYAVRWQGE